MFICSFEQIDPNLPDNLKNFLIRVWPGELTLIYKSKAYRMPKNFVLLKIIQDIGPLYSSSANISGKMPIKKLAEAKKVFAEDLKKIVLVKTNCEQSNIPSTIYDYDKKEIIRTGKLKKEDLFN